MKSESIKSGQRKNKMFGGEILKGAGMGVVVNSPHLPQKKN